MPKSDEWRYIGIDETNHGRFPEIFVAAYSNTAMDTHCHADGQFTKQRKSHNGLAGRLSHRGYSFIVVGKEILYGYREEQIFASVLVSLIRQIPRPSLEQIWIDGDLNEQKKEEMWRRLKKDCSITEKDISIQFGPKYDTKVYLVNLADEIAHHLYHQPLDKIARNPRKRDILLPNRK